MPQAGAGGYFDDGGFPAGKGWDEMGLPAVNDEHAYALEISGDAMKPAYRDGDVIVVSPGTPIRRGDRVVVKTTGGEVMVKELKRRTAKTLELASLNPANVDRTLAAGDVEWIARDRVGESVAPPHGEEPRSCAASRTIWHTARGHPSRRRAKRARLLRMRSGVYVGQIISASSRP